MKNPLQGVDLLSFKWFAENIFKIQTKVNGLQPFKLRRIQHKYIDHLNTEFKNGIIRSIVLKPRQSGFSTLVAGINTHRMLMWNDERGIMLADKLDRTSEVFSIYDTFRKYTDKAVLPPKSRKDVFNTQQIYFEHRRSGFKGETQNDPHAGRAGTRKWAHLTEFAFYSNADSIDEGIQNSIPLAPGTRIFKESTAFGMSGVGESFYNQWEAACRGDTIYRPFFVAWYEVDDYVMEPDRNFQLNSSERELMRVCPLITVQNLVWRRLKIREYAAKVDQIFSPEERFCQDFPSYPEEAFLTSGRPVFDQEKIKKHIRLLTDYLPDIAVIKVTRPYITMYEKMLTVFKVPSSSERYIIGADTAEGLSTGDFCSAFVMTRDCKQAAFFHGRIDPDHFGKLLVELAKIYNDALLVPEINNTGYATLAAIKNEGYLKVYMRQVFDEIGKEATEKMGWRTQQTNKQMMISKLISFYRDSVVQILDIGLVKEMGSLTRESNGDVCLNGKDKVVATCLAIMGLEQCYEPAKVTLPSEYGKVQYPTKDLFIEKSQRKVMQI